MIDVCDCRGCLPLIDWEEGLVGTFACDGRCTWLAVHSLQVPAYRMEVARRISGSALAEILCHATKTQRYCRSARLGYVDAHRGCRSRFSLPSNTAHRRRWGGSRLLNGRATADRPRAIGCVGLDITTAPISASQGPNRSGLVGRRIGMERVDTCSE